MSHVDIAPFQSLDEFILDTSRFSWPSRDPEKWANRVINNLLYYQSNYFALALVIFTLIGIYYPTDIIVGCLTLAAAFMIFVAISNVRVELKRFKKKYPAIGVLLIVALSFSFLYFIGSVAIFCFGIAFPLCVIFLHASTRLRSIKNKLANKMEYVGIRRTPMGLFLESIGLEEQAGA